MSSSGRGPAVCRSLRFKAPTLEFFVPYLGLYSADFVPPPPELVEDLVDDLIAFSNDDVLPAVAQAAIAHAQFETASPTHCSLREGPCRSSKKKQQLLEA